MFLRGLQGEDKPSPLLWTTWLSARSIVGAMACPRPAQVVATFAGIYAPRKNTRDTHFVTNSRRKALAK